MEKKTRTLTLAVGAMKERPMQEALTTIGQQARHTAERVVPKLPPTLQKYIDHIHAAGRPLDFTEIVSVTPRVNLFRCLKDRGLIRDIVPPYRSEEPWTGPRTSKFVLTEKAMTYIA